MEEVQRQIGPLALTVGRMNTTLRSLYRNGADPGGAPGALEIWREEDKKTFTEMAASINSLKDHKDQVSKWLLLEKDRRERLDKIWATMRRVGWKAAVAIAGGILTVGGWTYHKADPVLHILWDDYLRDHPVVTKQLKDVGTDTAPAYSDEKKQLQDAHIPPIVR